MVANFSAKPQRLDLANIFVGASVNNIKLIDLYSGRTPEVFNNTLVVPKYGFYWLNSIY